MRYLLTIALVIAGSLVYGQTNFLREAVAKLDRALLNKDTVTLKQLLHTDLTYGHSNGWIESKNDVIRDLYNGKLSYRAIKTTDQQWKAGKDWASVRSTAAVVYDLNGSAGEMKLHVLQVWIKTNKGWQLMARQSTKLN